MSETWWKTQGWGSIRIEPVQVKSSTDKYVTLESGRREYKGTDYYKTFAGARQFHMTRLDNYISSRRADIEKARDDLDRVFMMEEPK